MSDTISRCVTCGVADDVLTDDGTCTTCFCKKMDAAEGISYRYYIKRGSQPEQEVSKEDWVRTEREAGFYNTLGHPDEPGTGSFSTTQHGGLSGRKDAVKNVAGCDIPGHPNNYAHEHVGAEAYAR